MALAPPVVSPADTSSVAVHPPEASSALFPPPGTAIGTRLVASEEATSEQATHGLPRLEVQLEGPRRRVTDRETETVSGRILGGSPTQLVLHVNGTTQEVRVDGGSFLVSATLQRGLNDLRVVATDWRGMETADSITVEYVPPPVPDGIAITSPRNGDTPPPDAPPLILVEGQVEDRHVPVVRLVANGHTIPVPVRDGRFRKVLPLVDPVLRLRAELHRNGGGPLRSREVTIHAPSAIPSIGVFLMEWPQGMAGNQVEVSATWRGSPERLDVATQKVAVQTFGASPEEAPPEAFYFRMKTGVYTFVLRARSVSISGVRPSLYLPQGNRLTPRPLRPVSPNGSGEAILAKILFPHGVLWDQDEWFTGESQSADTVTKFRFPEGISWTERKRDLR